MLKHFCVLFLAGGLALAGCGSDDDSTDAPTCRDGVQNGDEEGIDCGGACAACDAEPTCRDGMQNGDEEGIDCGGVCAACPVTPTCDDGTRNGDEEGVDCGGSCPACPVTPTCSDGMRNGDEEGVDCGGSCGACTSCNDGMQNGDETSVDCGGSCAACPTCSDGQRNGDETGVDCGGSCDACPSCDDGEQNGDETGVDCGGSCDACVDCFPDGKRIFVTSRGYDGDLADNAGVEDGLEGGDALCQLHADAATLGGTFKAWLSTGDVAARDRIEDVGPWYLVDRCTLVTPNMANLLVSGPQVAIDLDENGEEHRFGNAWTGTEPTGQSAGFDCGDWTDRSPLRNGQAGTRDESVLQGAWTRVSTSDCNSELRLMCFEQ